ncbi:hypothetical protein DCC39_12505 [Pueribacillus theae]|uniref:Integrase catalytic domain-containing protein n=1 Tax=Pueribacillus theae TaxID=2171751 RepID=A0A2U1JX48_9BACI|nr:hypothetical protein DCC39_12505 [Pueribacillus theae]
MRVDEYIQFYNYDRCQKRLSGLSPKDGKFKLLIC